jgi:hypothetical protein
MNQDRSGRHGRRVAIPLLTFVFVSLILGGCGGSGGGGAAPPQDPTITSFSAAKSPITAGTSTTLTAVFSGGTGVVSHGVGTVTSGVAVSTGALASTTSFTLTVTGPTVQTATSVATVEVVPPPAITEFTAAPATVPAGAGSTLSYSFTGGQGSIDQGLGSVTSGGTTVVAPDATTAYTLTVTNSAGTTVTRSVTVTVQPAGVNTPPVARTGPAQTVDVGTMVTTDGSESSDADGDALAFRWSIESRPAGSTAALSGVNLVQASFLPDLAGTYRVQLVVNDGKVDGTPVATDVTAVAGALLAGDRDDLALAALTDMPPLAVDDSQVVNGVIMTRIDVRLRVDATVGEVNDALAAVGGRIVTMLPEFPTITVSIPRAADRAALEAVVQTLRQAPGIHFASVGRVNRPRRVPTDSDQFLEDLTYLRPTRFPAAWNASKLALESCGSANVRVLVADEFVRPYPPGYGQRFAAEVPGFTAVPVGESDGSEHGYDVTTTLAGLFDAQHPTGANPFPACLQITGIRMTNLTTPQENQRIHRIVRQFPSSSRFVLNYSYGYVDLCAEDCSVSEIVEFVNPPIQRAYDALDWKLLTHRRWGDYLAVTAAGNEADEPSAQIYAGLGEAAYTSSISMASRDDPYFRSILDTGLWNAAKGGFPNLTATGDEAASLAELVQALGMDSVGRADNVLITGATTNAAHAKDVEQTEFSDRLPDVAATGEDVCSVEREDDGYCTKIEGTSFSSPQVAGLASYLWLLSPDLRDRPAQIARRAIRENARLDRGKNVWIIDAYASVLSLDQAVPPTPETAPMRFALLNVVEDDVFDEKDVELYLQHYFDRDGEPLESDDCGRFDLNGDCITGGDHTERFDLDLVGSEQYGYSDYKGFTKQIEGRTMFFDEHALADRQILCYYAYSPDFYRGDVTRRKDLLQDKCAPPVSLDITYAVVDAATGTPYCDDDIRFGVENAFNDPVALPVHASPSCTTARSEMTLRQVEANHLALDFSMSAQAGGAMLMAQGHIPAGSYRVRIAPVIQFSPGFTGQRAQYAFYLYPRIEKPGFPAIGCEWKDGNTTGWGCVLPRESSYVVDANQEYVWMFFIVGSASPLDTISISGQVLSIQAVQ